MSGANREEYGFDPAVEEFPEGTKTPADAGGDPVAGRIKDELGWSIGGVPPFCHDRPVPVVDETHLEFGTVWAAAGTPEAVFPIDPTELRRYAGGEPAAVAE